MTKLLPFFVLHFKIVVTKLSFCQKRNTIQAIKKTTKKTKS